MPNFVALELNDDVMVVACAKGSGKNFQIHQLFEIETNDRSDAELGEALKAALAERSVAKSELIGVVTRRQVEMREVSVPPAPDNELPELVRFQARNVFASMNDNWKLDYIPFEESRRLNDGGKEADAAGDQTKVLAIAISPNLSDQYAAIADSAGLKLKRIVFGPYSCCSLYEPVINDESNRLLIVPAAGHFDCVVASGPDLVAARSIRSLSEGQLSARQIISEVRRTIASTKSLLGSLPVEQILIAASEENFGEIGSEVGTVLDLPVRYFDIFTTLQANQLTAAKPELPEHFAAVIGSLAVEYSSRRQPVDFVNPRRPTVRKYNFKPALLGVGAAVLLLLMSASYAWFSLNSLHNQLQSKTEEYNKVKVMNAGTIKNPGVDQIIAEVKKLDDWEKDRVNWLHELKELSGFLLTPEDIIVTKLDGQPARGAGISIILQTRMTEETNMMPEWKELLFDEYRVKPGDSTPDDSESDYPFKSTLTLVKTPHPEPIMERISAEAERLKQIDMQAQAQAVEETTEPVNTGATPEPTNPATPTQ